MQIKCRVFANCMAAGLHLSRQEGKSMKPRSIRVLPGLLATAVLAFAAAHISADYDHHADFSRYRTYSWIGVRAGDSLWQDRIQSAVEGQLAAKGWTRVPSGGDAAVSAIGRVNERDTIQTFYDGFP